MRTRGREVMIVANRLSLAEGRSLSAISRRHLCKKW